MGICGTDVEIASGAYGWAPPGRERLILGHESLGRVVDPGPDRSVKAGDLIVGIVRRPDPVPCPNCAVGEWDMCRNGQYTERGIKEIDGFMSERWRIEPGYFTKVDPSLGLLAVLLEPTTVVAKAWELVAAMRARAFWQPRQVLVTGAGPIGMLAALIGVQHGLDVHVLDRVTEGAKPQLVRDLGATYHSGAIADLGFEPDVVIECTGVGPVIVDSIRQVAAGGVVCLTGVGGGGSASGLSTGRRRQGPGPAEQRGPRLGQRQPAALLPGGRGARGRRPRVAGAADLASGGARRTSPTRCSAAPTTSRSSWTSGPDDDGGACGRRRCRRLHDRADPARGGSAVGRPPRRAAAGGHRGRAGLPRPGRATTARWSPSACTSCPGPSG